IVIHRYSGREYTTCVRTADKETAWCLIDDIANWGYCTDQCEEENFSSEDEDSFEDTEEGGRKGRILLLEKEMQQLKANVVELSRNVETGEQAISKLREDVALLNNTLLHKNMVDGNED
ncbi:unnamed protein product, partial [Meganyctiphanes norvegica]